MVLGKSAAAQALVYLYQFESAMHWLLISVIDFISIEMDNDVVSQLKNRVIFSKIYEQGKSSTVSSNVFSDSNINLLKTLAIWLSISKSKPNPIYYECYN
jgi:hypothetical protein